MPIVQSYGAPKVDLLGIPGVRKTAAETPGSEGVQLDEANAQKGETIAGVGGALTRLGTSEYDRQQAEIRQDADNTAIISANRQRDDWEFQAVHDPVNGAIATTKKKDALGLVQTVIPAFDDKVTEIAGTLNNRQRDAFLRQSLASRESLRTTLDNYGVQQAKVYKHDEYVGALDSSQKLAIANISENPLRVGMEMARTEGIINQYADSEGVGPEARAAMLGDARTRIHVGAIDGLLVNGQPRQAQEYFSAFKDQIGGDQLADVEKKLQAATVAGDAQRASNTIWASFAPKTDESPIELDRMEDAARAQFGDDPKTLKATIESLRERKAGVDASRRERVEATAGTLWRDVNNGATLDQIRSSPAYLAAPGALQLQVSQHIVQQAQARADRSYTLSERDYAAARRAEAEKEQNGWAMRWHYDDPRVLSQMSEDQVLALTPDLGMGNVNELLVKQRAYAASAEKVRKASIDDDQFKTIAASAGLPAYAAGAANTKAAEQRKAELGQLRNTVESAIADEQARNGRELTRDEKGKVMQGVVDHHVMVKSYVLSDTSHVAAAVVNERDKAKSYVPVAQIPQASLNEWVNVIRANFPQEQQRTRDEILSIYRDRIQRAHAASVLRLGADEELRRLQGR